MFSNNADPAVNKRSALVESVRRDCDQNGSIATLRQPFPRFALWLASEASREQREML